MIHDLGLALKMSERCNSAEFVVSESVLFEILHFPNRGMLWMQLNVPQDNFKYRFLSRIYWRGLLFIHPSRDPVSVDAEMASSCCG